MSKSTRITLLVSVLAIGIFLAIYIPQKRACDAENGFLVRGVWGIQCIPYRNDMQEFGGYDKLQ